MCATILTLQLAAIAAAASPGPSVRDLLQAMTVVESGGDAGRIGDSGRSRGPLQIQRQYWQDAWRGVDRPGSYRRVHDQTYAERTVLRYWQLHAPRALKLGRLDHLARVHNGGPAGYSKAATTGYWTQVRRELRKLTSERER